MANIRGISVISAIKYVRDNYGEGGWTKITDSLDDEDRNIIRGNINPMTWYPLKVFTNFIETTDKIFGKGNYEVCLNIGRFNAQDTFTGLYKVFLELGNPHFVIRRGHIAWRTIVDTGELEVEQAGDKYVKAKIINFSEPHKAFCWKVAGYFDKVLEMSGARNVQVKETKCALEGSDFCEYEIQWE